MPLIKELKLKATVGNIEDLKNKVRGCASFIEKKETVDYFFKADINQVRSELRIRKSDDDKIVTLKILSAKDEVQENTEYKFKVDRAGDFVNFLEYVGFKPATMIKKRSETFKFENIIIEIAEIDGVGCYIELIMHGKNKFSDEDKLRLINLLLGFGIKREAIDSRYYSDIKGETEG